MKSLKDVTVADNRQNSWRRKVYQGFKRLFDIAISVALLLFFSPLFLIVAALIKLDDGGPVIYCHNRVGKDGYPIRIFKFRTMRATIGDAEEFLTPEQLEEYEREFKLANDPRVTKKGRFFRATSIDELPQLLNILKGDMSLIGPRPLVWNELISKYTETEREELLSVKPGLTGYWQCHGRSDSTYENGRRQALELYYVKHQSLWLDIKILLMTPLVVIIGGGAY